MVFSSNISLFEDGCMAVWPDDDDGPPPPTPTINALREMCTTYHHANATEVGCCRGGFDPSRVEVGGCHGPKIMM
jgi:hypothetical protein